MRRRVALTRPSSPMGSRFVISLNSERRSSGMSCSCTGPNSTKAITATTGAGREMKIPMSAVISAGLPRVNFTMGPTTKRPSSGGKTDRMSLMIFGAF